MNKRGYTRPLAQLRRIDGIIERCEEGLKPDPEWEMSDTEREILEKRLTSARKQRDDLLGA